MFARPALIAALLALAACQPTTPTSTTPTGSAMHTELDDLPLTAGLRAEIASELGRLDSPEAASLCTAEERSFIRVSAMLMAVYLGEDETRPWTAPQEAKVAALRTRWEALGGDNRDVSDRCRSLLPAMMG
ncbi:hypothetical protein [Salipiger mucosus]|uniref:Lipoprotein n=1 Tax=Salipiger mucosus DSM 16094 TaxID=1123237 RepID=S9S9P0_9RHOB|nr:hypothetical protein [Salipiger mucosus]EPX86880.1 hypothetical protein Salmuc_01531 [Salipiger mucosus DSM 16094]